MLSEYEIIQGCKKNKAKYQELLYKRYCSAMYGVCLRYSNDKAEAADCMQEGFIRVFNNINSFKGEGSLEGWIRKIMVNTALNNYKANLKSSYHADLEDAKNIASDYSSANDNISEQELLTVIQELSEGYRLVFNLYAIEGYSHKEIAEMLEISESTSKSQLSRARVLLQKKLTSIYNYHCKELSNPVIKKIDEENLF